VQALLLGKTIEEAHEHVKATDVPTSPMIVKSK